MNNTPKFSLIFINLGSNRESRSRPSTELGGTIIEHDRPEYAVHDPILALFDL